MINRENGDFVPDVTVKGHIKVGNNLIFPSVNKEELKKVQGVIYQGSRTVAVLDTPKDKYLTCKCQVVKDGIIHDFCKFCNLALACPFKGKDEEREPSLYDDIREMEVKIPKEWLEGRLISSDWIVGDTRYRSRINEELRGGSFEWKDVLLKLRVERSRVIEQVSTLHQRLKGRGTYDLDRYENEIRDEIRLFESEIKRGEIWELG